MVYWMLDTRMSWKIAVVGKRDVLISFRMSGGVVGTYIKTYHKSVEEDSQETVTFKRIRGLRLGIVTNDPCLNGKVHCRLFINIDCWSSSVARSEMLQRTILHLKRRP